MRRGAKNFSLQVGFFLPKGNFMEVLETKKVDDKTAICYLAGRLDVSLASEIEERLNAFLDKEGVLFLLLNLEKVEYMSSSGFRVAIAVLRKLKSKGGTLVLCSLQPPVRRLFDIIELSSLFEIFDTEKEALEYLKQKKEEVSP